MFLLLLNVNGNFYTRVVVLWQLYTFVVNLQIWQFDEYFELNFRLTQNEAYASEQRLMKKLFCQKMFLNTAIFFVDIWWNLHW